MDIRNTCLIVLFAILLPHLVSPQDSTYSSELPTETSGTIESSTTTTTASITTTASSTTTTPATPTPPTTPTTPSTTTTANRSTTGCEKPDHFPLFGPSSCIPREAYAGIFLTSIILAGISFLMVIGLLIMLCTRRSRSSGSSFSGDSESRTSDGNGGTTDSPPVKKRAAGTTPPDDTTPRRTKQAYSNKTGPITDTQTPPSTSRAPYTDVKPVPKPAARDVQSRNVKPKESESHEMTSRQPDKPPTNTSRTQPSSSQTAAQYNGPSGKGRNKNVSPDNELESSQF